MGAARQSPTPRARRWYPSSESDDWKRFECRRGSSAPAFLVLLIASFIVASCSEKAPPSKAETEAERTETEQQPREDEIAEDCVAFVRATKVVSQAPTADCPGCSQEGAELLAFRQMRLERISCSAETCQATVTLRVAFNPAPAGTISGGLTAWISPEQRAQYLNGQPPEGEQVYRVKIIYKRTAKGWRAIEFDKADP